MNSEVREAERMGSDWLAGSVLSYALGNSALALFSGDLRQWVELSVGTHSAEQ